jgi:hypothetical protein
MTIFKTSIFWVVTPCSLLAGYQRFGGACCLHLQDPNEWAQDVVRLYRHIVI